MHAPFVPPMLLKRATPFDSADYMFEVKWDGARGIACVGRDGYRIFSRKRLDVTASFPELQCLRRLPAGTVLDGELVVLRGGKPDLRGLLSRFGTRSEVKSRMGASQSPVTFVAFDQLYDNYDSIMGWPLRERRERLQQVLDVVNEAPLVFSGGIRERGKTLFQEIVRRGLEGVVAKRLESRYRPGTRSDAWLKIKPEYIAPP